ncbi:MAG: DUF983 domain-containing protein [Bacteroidetes bacterium]|nr:DUF983 domain-containing protein [Bacteroidota bacterium]
MSTPKWRNAFALKCPTCGEGNLFQSKHPYDLKNVLKMNSKCSSCKEDFEIETGFYQGAMFMSYMFSCALCLALLPIYAAFNFSRDKFLDNVWYYLVACFIALVVTWPYITQLSRAVWLFLHLKYVKHKPTENAESGI